MKRIFSRISLTETDVEKFIGIVLRYGVVISCIVVCGGGLLYLLQSGGQVPHYSQFVGEPSSLNSLSAVLSGIRHFDGKIIIQLGVILLIATPIVRILISVFSFMLEKDYRYVFITLFVLSVIIFSMFMGLKE